MATAAFQAGDSVMTAQEVQAKADHALSILDVLADVWSAEVNLTAMIKNAVSPMGLNRSVPDDVVASMRHRMEVQIDAIARQAFLEGAYRAITGSQDERKVQGLVIAPMEPTEEMITAGLIPTAAWQDIKGSALTVNREKMRLRYKAMIAALTCRPETK